MLTDLTRYILLHRCLHYVLTGFPPSSRQNHPFGLWNESEKNIRQMIFLFSDASYRDLISISYMNGT